MCEMLTPGRDVIQQDIYVRRNSSWSEIPATQYYQIWNNYQDYKRLSNCTGEDTSKYCVQEIMMATVNNISALLFLQFQSSWCSRKLSFVEPVTEIFLKPGRSFGSEIPCNLLTNDSSPFEFVANWTQPITGKYHFVQESDTDFKPMPMSFMAFHRSH